MFDQHAVEPVGEEGTIGKETLKVETSNVKMEAKSQRAWSALCCCKVTEIASETKAVDALADMPGHWLDEVAIASNGDVLALSSMQRAAFYAFHSDMHGCGQYASNGLRQVAYGARQLGFHPCVSDAPSFKTDQVSFQGLAQSILGQEYELVFCGFRIGGAQAQATAFLLHSHFKHLGQPSSQISCISFGQPKVMDAVYLKGAVPELHVEGLFTNYQIEGDVLPGLLTPLQKGKGANEEWQKLCDHMDAYFHSKATSTDLAGMQQTFVDCIGSCKSNNHYGSLGSILVLKSKCAADGTNAVGYRLEEADAKTAFYCGADQVDSLRPQTWHTTISAPGGYIDMFTRLWRPEGNSKPALSKAMSVADAAGTFELGVQVDQDGTRAFKADFWGQGLHWLDMQHGLRLCDIDMASEPMMDGSIVTDVETTECHALMFASSFEVSGTLKPSALQIVNSRHDIMLCVKPQFAPPVLICLDKVASAQGNGMISGVCPEVVIQKALLIACSKMRQTGWLAALPLLDLVEDLDRSCYCFAANRGDVDFQNCYAKDSKWYNIKGVLMKHLHRGIAVDGQTLVQQERVANYHDADVPALYDLVNLRGFCFGPVATAIQHIATVLESGQLLVHYDGTRINAVNKMYAEKLVQPVCVRGRTDAQLPAGTSSRVQQDGLVLLKCRQLIDGTMAAAKDEEKQYQKCLKLLAKLLVRNTCDATWQEKQLHRLSVATLEKIVSDYILQSGLDFSDACKVADSFTYTDADNIVEMHVRRLDSWRFCDKHFGRCHSLSPRRYHDTRLDFACVKAVHLQMCAVASMAKLRKAVDQYCLIGVTGLQNGGKSTLTERLIGRQGACVAGYKQHTITADVYELQSCASSCSIHLVDTPGINASQSLSIAETALAVGGRLNAVIFVTQWNGSPDKDQIVPICKMMCHKLPMLVCLNKAGAFDKDIVSEEDGWEYIAKWEKDIYNKCNADGVSYLPRPLVWMTEFVSTPNKDKGIKGVPEVLAWIQKHAAKCGYIAY